MKRIYLVIDDGSRAIAETIKTGENLMPFIQRYKAEICHICESRSEADRIALQWNMTRSAEQ